MKEKIMQLKYISEFKCSGSNCRNNCCHSWRVLVDKTTFEMYQNLKEPLWLVEKLKKYIVLNASSTADFDYAEIVYADENKICPFLDENKLCEIQLNLGLEYLGIVCEMFPRKVGKFYANGKAVYKYSGDSGCEEVIKIFLEDKNATNIIEREREVKDPNSEKPSKHKYKDLRKYYLEIKFYGMELLKYREYTFEDRLALAGLYFQTIQSMDDINTIDNIPELSEKFGQAVHNGFYDEALEASIPRYDIWTQYTSHIFGLVFTETHIKNDIFKTVYNYINSSEKNTALILNNYKDYMQDKQHFLENIFVNEFINSMVLTSHLDMWEITQWLTTVYSILKLMIAGYYAQKGNSMSDIELIDVTTFTLKSLTHNKITCRKILDDIKTHQMDTPEFMMTIAKT